MKTKGLPNVDSPFSISRKIQPTSRTAALARKTMPILRIAMKIKSAEK
jgi:hypothetical protein